jgi:ABC-2 type transport system ATP-binding protein
MKKLRGRNMPVIEIQGLRKEYRRLRGGSTIALDGLDLVVPGGGVFGFLGPNGSGKTTTIRCLLGLATPTAGRCTLLDADVRSELASVIRRVGSIVETPALFPTFSARRNLQLLARTYGIDDDKVEEVLVTVGLADRAKSLVKTYSLGMKQRLGIAAALLKDPDVLILDEPANGLDPAGIKEVRELVRRLGGEGRTVFVSSHILSEVRQMCDQVAILAHGRCVAAGPVDEVLHARRTSALVVGLADLDAGLKVLQAADIAATRAGDRLRVDVPPSQAAKVTRVLAEASLYVTELRPEEIDLETVFLELTQDQDPEVAA